MGALWWKIAGSYRYVYGAPLIGKADASSSMIGLQKKSVRVAMKREMGELRYATFQTTRQSMVNSLDSERSRLGFTADDSSVLLASILAADRPGR
jgi:hypothetical protein